MKINLTTSIHIHSKPEEIWDILMDFEKYAEWNPFISEISGKAINGSLLSVLIDNMKFKPIVLKVDPNKEFRWKGKLVFKGLFDGEHIFQLEDLGNGIVRFHQSENFSGILVRLFQGMIHGKTKNGFIKMNEALKKRVGVYKVQ